MTTTTAVPRPTCPAHRQDLLLDAIAELDMAVVHVLIAMYHATRDEVHRAIEQTERSFGEVLAAYQAFRPKIAATKRCRRDVNRVLLILAQPPLIPIAEVAR